jgi:hypothetical protein
MIALGAWALVSTALPLTQLTNADFNGPFWTIAGTVTEIAGLLVAAVGFLLLGMALGAASPDEPSLAPDTHLEAVITPVISNPVTDSESDAC